MGNAGTFGVPVVGDPARWLLPRFRTVGSRGHNTFAVDAGDGNAVMVRGVHDCQCVVHLEYRW